MHGNDPLANVLHIDLTSKDSRVVPRSDLFEKYLGGAGVAIQLLHEECPEGCPPLEAGNPIIFAVGPLTGLFPMASKTVAMFKSPLTGNLGESHCGGRTAVAIRMAGYGAVVIKGASDIPLYLSIRDDKVLFRDASALWGMENCFTVGRIIRENEPRSDLRTIMRIGGAGERMIPYAVVTAETYRHFGRLGLGAVFGSKKLKAVAISGRRSLPVSNSKEYMTAYRDIHRKAVDSPAMKKYHDVGTAVNVLPLNEMGGLPTRNLREARFEGAVKISGEMLVEQFLGRRLACSQCPVACIHIAALREPYRDEAYFFKTSMISYDYEHIFSLGSMLGISDPKGLLPLIEMVETWGLDVMSTGVVLAWATEAMERGIVSEKETFGIRLGWGLHNAYRDAIKKIIEQPNDFYKALARGVEYASSKYGGKDFALAFGGNEMPGYHTGPAAHIGVLMGSRHSHLDNGGYSVDQKVLLKKQIPPEELVEILLREEYWRQIMSSLVTCFFARGIYDPGTVLRTLALTGFDLGTDDLNRIAKAIHREKYRFKTREGFSLENIRIPGRIFETPALVNRMDEDYIRRALRHVGKVLREA